MRSTELIIDNTLKIVQMLFYITVASVTILTYKSAKNGLLNTVNTEYQKKVIDKLEEISIELSSEFDPISPNYWPKSKPINDMISKINENFERNKDYILEIGEYPFGIIVPSNIARLTTFVSKIKSDPFLSKEIREVIVELLGKRTQITMKIYQCELEIYAESLVYGVDPFKTDGQDTRFDEIHNLIVEKLNEEGCDITTTEATINKIRSYIQIYLESFNPVKRRIPVNF